MYYKANLSVCKKYLHRKLYIVCSLLKKMKDTSTLICKSWMIFFISGIVSMVIENKKYWQYLIMKIISFL